MDLQSFCVENRRKVHSFPFLRSAVHSTEKMSKSFQFGVPVNSSMMEENCLKNLHNMPCNAQFTFQGIAKNQDCSAKKSCLDQLNKFSHFAFSRVVGGFVGSKSQGGSASREPHQVWDVIFRQLVDTACQATMNDNAQSYFSIGEAVSQSIFGQLNNSRNSTLDFSSYIFTKPCDFFESKKMPGNIPSTNVGPFHASGTRTTTEEKLKSCKDPSDVQLHSVVEKNVNLSKPELQQNTSKQSYADVAKAFVTTKPEAANYVEKHQSALLSSLPQKNKSTGLRQTRKENNRFNSKRNRQNGSCYTQPYYNHSSQNQQQRKYTVLLEKGEDQVPSKFIRDKYEHPHHLRTEKAYSSKQKAKSPQLNSPEKDLKMHEERKSRFNKFRNHNMREKERKNIDYQVQEETVFACNMPEQICQNWRCDHNRNNSMCRTRTDFRVAREQCGSRRYKWQSRIHSPPPRTFLTESIKRSDSKKIDDRSIKRVHENPVLEGMCEETLCNSEQPSSNSVNLTRSEDIGSESSFPGSTSNITVLSQRSRVASECSIDSEDSYVVFEKDDLDAEEAESDCESDSDSGNDYSSECESDEDCDEVDFCYIIPSEDIIAEPSGSLCSDVFSSVPDRLKDVNAKWEKENAVLPKRDKVPKQVHFPSTEELTKVHLMIHWPFAYREARRGPWEEIGRDRCRFQARIERAERDLSCVLSPEHRRRIWEERMCCASKI